MSTARFALSAVPLDGAALRAGLADPACGGFVAFEGWVRNHNEGLTVQRLAYEAFETLALAEGERIIAETAERFGIERIRCVHRVGELAIGELAVWVGVATAHRDEAFRAARHVIDAIKHRVPIWKKEYYTNGDSGWVNCERCAVAPVQDVADEHHHQHEHAHAHEHEHRRADAGVAAPAATLTPRVPDYSRQTQLPQIGPAGQQKLAAARVLVVGAGGLGVPVLQYLAGAGIGVLGIVDDDVLDASNLHRQPLYTLAECGQPKALLAAARIRALNPQVEVQVHGLQLNEANADALLGNYDLVVDCSDNFRTKFAINDSCRRLNKTGVFASVYQYEGQLQVVRPAGACLRCVWPEAPRDGLVANCQVAGVLGPVPGVLGNLQAMEVLKLLLDLPGALRDEVLLLDLLFLSTRRVAAHRDRDCAARHGRESMAPPSVELEMQFGTLAEARAAGFTLIDIREDWERAAQPAPGASAVSVADLLEQAPARQEEALLILCAAGVRSLAAAQLLHSRGLRQVRSLRGGLSGLRRLQRK
ncbi:MAG: ThiF family adenylyltransferase [Steroidobacteraceae bacterium]